MADNVKESPDGTIRYNGVFRNPEQVYEEMAAATAYGETIYSRAEAEKRAPNEEELKDVDRYLEYFKVLNDVELPRAKQLAEQARVTAHKHLQTMGATKNRQETSVGNRNRFASGFHQQGATSGLPRRLRTNLKAFAPDKFEGGAAEAHEAAMMAGHWLKAYVGLNAPSDVRAQIPNLRESINFCRDNEQLRLDNYDHRMDAQTVDDATKGQVLVPEIVSRSIIDVRDQFGLTRRICRQYPMASETDRRPKRQAGLTVFKPGEDNPVTKSEKTIGSISLSATDGLCATSISHKLMRGSVIDAAEMVISEIGYGFARQQDYELIAADGSAPQPDFGAEGVINFVGAAGTLNGTGAGTGWASVTVADIDLLIGLLPSRFDAMSNQDVTDGSFSSTQGPCFICHRSFYFRTIVPILRAGGGNTKLDIGNGSPRMLEGYPVKFSEWMPSNPATVDAPALVFGNFYEGVEYGERESVGISVSEHEEFMQDNIVIKGRMSWDLNFHEKGDGVNAGAIVLLKTKA